MFSRPRHGHVEDVRLAPEVGQETGNTPMNPRRRKRGPVNNIVYFDWGILVYVVWYDCRVGGGGVSGVVAELHARVPVPGRTSYRFLPRRDTPSCRRLCNSLDTLVYCGGYICVFGHAYGRRFVEKTAYSYSPSSWDSALRSYLEIGGPVGR
ncbi:hypothetical protein AAG570_007386 [Ranatra chinensis]|uniref:Uncharacterized protein n=1 Tax=Ranatra chinensis TaxID=642074 RepID=A0ABD0XVQ7_9HEMI